MQFIFLSPAKINFRSVILLFRFFLPVISLTCGSFNKESGDHLICKGSDAKSYPKDYDLRLAYSRGSKSCHGEIIRINTEEDK